MESTRDEPLTPTGRFFLHPKFNNVISCAIGFKHPFNIEATKEVISNSLMVKQPRFSSLLVLDNYGREFWRRTQINFDDHIIIHHKQTSSESYSDEEQEEKINDILADFAVSSPLSTEKPLWEFHIYVELKCMIIRFHHALGDGTTLMSMFLADCKRCDDNKGDYVNEKRKENKGARKRAKGLMGTLKMIWWTILAVMGFVGRSLCVRDKKTAISGGDGVELWPRMMATAKFSLQDMKTVKRAIANSTINDVLFGIISLGLSKYMETRSSHALREGLQITGLTMVNLRKQPGLQELSKMMEDYSTRSAKWGNEIGMMLLPVYCHKKNMDPLNYVKRAKVMIDRKKQSLEAHFSYEIGKFLMSLFGPKVVSMLYYKIACNTTFTISNIIGPHETVSFADNPITFVRPTTTSAPHALTMHMTSYAEKANMQILVAKDIIPDPQFLAKCFEDALLEMKYAAPAPLTQIIVPP